MATIRKIRSGWQAQVARRGVRTSKTFPTKREAQDWAARQEHLILAGEGKYGPGQLKDVLQRYARTESPKKRGERWEILRLNLIGRSDLGSKSLKSLTAADFAQWRDKRLTEVAPASVRREMQILSAVLNTAVNEWGILPKNPLKVVARPTKPPARERRVAEAEIALLIETAGTDLTAIRPRCIHAFCFGIETAMRAGEILALTRDDVSGSVARLHTSKTGKGRDVPLSRAALALWEALPGDGFDLTSRQLDANFRAIRDKAGIKGLTFHDSRHEAITRLSKKVQVLSLAKIVGHDDIRQLMTYYDESAEDIAKLLD